MTSGKTIVDHMFSFKKRRININFDIIINTTFGFLVALIFKDFKDIFIDHVFANILKNNLNKKKKTLTILNTELNIDLFIDFIVHIIFILIFIFIFLYKRI